MNKTIIISVATVAVLTFSGCGNQSKEESSKNNTTTTVEKTTQEVKESASKVAEATKEVATKTVEKAKEATAKTVEKAKEAVETTKEVAAKTTEAVKESATKATEATKEAVTKAAQKVEKAVSSSNDKGKAVFAKCVSCHGADGKTKALGKSEIIAGQAVADLEKKLSEYKAGTRNVAGMGTLMNGQVKGLSDDDIKAVAEYISSLK